MSMTVEQAKLYAHCFPITAKKRGGWQGVHRRSEISEVVARMIEDDRVIQQAYADELTKRIARIDWGKLVTH